MPFNLTINASSPDELQDAIMGLANTFGYGNQKAAVCNCTNEVVMHGVETGRIPSTPVEETPEYNQADQENESHFNPESENYTGDNNHNDDESDDEDSDDNSDDEDETEDELTGCNDAPNDEIASHFDEIFGTVGNRPMCGDRVTINGSLFQGGGKVVNTNYSLLYNSEYDYNTKIIKVKADNGKKYSYNKSDLRAKKVNKA